MWIGTVQDQAGHAVGQRVGPARTRTCDHEQRACIRHGRRTVLHGLTLGLVEISERIGPRCAALGYGKAR